jgi:thiosulfate reductase cytochrome b subunit
MRPTDPVEATAALATSPEPPAAVSTDRSSFGAAGHAVGATPAPRRGLPRVAGAEPRARAGAQPMSRATEVVPSKADPENGLGQHEPPAPRQGLRRGRAVPESTSVAVGATSVAPAQLRVPLPSSRAAWPGVAASVPSVAKAPRKRIGPFTRAQWAGTVLVVSAGLLFTAGMAVALVRWLLSLDPLQDFLSKYPGEYHLPVAAPVGIPAWLGWQHVFNVFLMVLIIRSGLQVRRQQKPPATWSPRWNPSRKISITLWFHQALDILWLVNGLVFVALLFATGQWMRIVPTSWEVFPNALSAGLQYVSLDWPTENGWVNYNSLQQLAYFATVFIAAPLAIVTGVRMSGVWPTNANTLNKLYPVEWARAVHFPVMLYFVVFIAIHVFLVFATGALRNLNHMYAARGSTDPNAFAGNWAGFWWFTASLAVIAVAWVAARPLVLAPIARRFGTVHSR